MFKKGDVVFLVFKDYLIYNKTISEEYVKIDKVGNIYYTLSNGLKINKTNLLGGRGEYSCKIYKDKEEYNSLKIGEEMFDRILKIGSNHNFTKYQMQQVYKILGLQFKNEED